MASSSLSILPVRCHGSNTKENFGRIILKHGHRIVELGLKYYF
jgi:hypothetical protein